MPTPSPSECSCQRASPPRGRRLSLLWAVAGLFAVVGMLFAIVEVADGGAYSMAADGSYRGAPAAAAPSARAVQPHLPRPAVAATVTDTGPRFEPEIALEDAVEQADAAAARQRDFEERISRLLASIRADARERERAKGCKTTAKARVAPEG